MLPTTMKVQHESFWKIAIVLVVGEVLFCDAQTFQYSRGWTNGKRSGSGASRVGYLPGQGSSRVFEVDGGVVSVPLEDPSLSAPATHMNLSPQGRVRSLDYNQIVNRKLSSNGFAIRKQPVWIGPLMGIDQEANVNNNVDF